MSTSSTPPPDKSISDADWAETPESVRVYVRKLGEKRQRNSRNSSQPSSQDTPNHKQTKPEKPKSDRSRGGQTGHACHERALLPQDMVDEIIIYRPETCRNCGDLLAGEDVAPYRYQVTDIPVVRASVVEHQVHCLVYTMCQTPNRGQLPAEVVTGQFGPQVVSLIAVLMGVYRLSKRQVVSILSDCFGVEIAVGSVVNQQYAVSEALAVPVSQVQRFVQQQAACNMDETRWRQRGQPKTGWLWVVVTRVASLFQVALSRSQDVAKSLLGDDYDGVVGSDRAGSYAWLNTDQRQVCWSHLLRDFQAILERGGDSFVIGTNLKLQGDYLLMLWARTRDDRRLSYLGCQCFDLWLILGSSATLRIPAKFIRRLP